MPNGRWSWTSAALFEAERRDTNRVHARCHPRHRKLGPLDPDVVGLGQATADPQATGASRPCVVGRASGHRKLGVDPLEHGRTRPALGFGPRGEHIEQLLPDRGRPGDATIEQHRGRVHEGVPGRQRFPSPGQERREVPGDARIGRVGQAQRGEARAFGLLGPGVGGCHGKGTRRAPSTRSRPW